LFSTLDEASQSNADFIYTPFENTDPAIFGIPSVGVGTHTVSLAASTSSGVSQFRVALLDGSNNVLGVSDWQDFDSTWTVYNLPVTIASGSATRCRIEVAAYPEGLLSLTDGPLSITDGFVSLV
jgi:hypothetical protein